MKKLIKFKIFEVGMNSINVKNIIEINSTL